MQEIAPLGCLQKIKAYLKNLHSFNLNRPSMRIRKRRPPPPPPSPPRHPSDLESSTLQLPPSSSDSAPLLHHSHDLLQPCDSPNQSLRSVTEDGDRRRPDLDLAAVSRTDGVDEKQSTHCKRRGANQDPPVGVGEEEDEVAAEENAAVETNRRIVYGHGVEKTSAGSSISSFPSHQGHWCEEDKLFPLKKRRASFTSKVRERTIKESVRRGRREIKKNWVEGYNYYQSEGEEEEEDVAVVKHGAKKAESGGKKTMEAWRCSRRNGRGWRCHQPTLLGYSLCEHHLSQARLRSLNSTTVRSRNGPDIQPKPKNIVYTNLYSEDKDKDDEIEEEEEEEKGFRKRRRICILKARSISSLLGQTLPSPPPVLL